MADLTSCYFCGTVGDLREYPVIPRDLYPPDDAQRTVDLCPGCREKLGTVVEPLVEFVESGADAAGNGTADRNGDRDAGGTSRASPSVPDAEASRAGPATSNADSEAPEPATGASDDAAAASGAAASPDGESALDELVEAESTTSVYTRSRGAGYRWEPGQREASAVGANLPEGTRKVARLLQNRSLPVERAAIEELAASAYDLEASACRGIVDALVEEGYLVERGGALHEPESG